MSGDSFWWATVTATGPLRIRRDGDADPLPITPDALVSGLVVGARVWCQRSGRAVIILGRNNG